MPLDNKHISCRHHSILLDKYSLSNTQQTSVKPSLLNSKMKIDINIDLILCGVWYCFRFCKDFPLEVRNSNLSYMFSSIQGKGSTTLFKNTQSSSHSWVLGPKILVML